LLTLAECYVCTKQVLITESLCVRPRVVTQKLHTQN